MNPLYERLKNNERIAKLLKHPSVLALLGQDDAITIERRVQLASKRLAIKGGKYAKAEAEANAKLAAAAKKTVVAKAAYDAALREEGAAFGAANALSNCGTRELSEIERELGEAADPRVRMYLGYVDVLWDTVRHGIRVEHDDLTPKVLSDGFTIDPKGGTVRVSGENSALVLAAMAVISSVLCEARELYFAALTCAEMTARLEGLNKKLAPALPPFNLLPPQISDSDVEPGQSLWPVPTDKWGMAMLAVH